MNLVDVVSTKPPGMDLGKWVSQYIKGVYSRHTEYLKTASEKGNPLQPESVEWLNDAKLLADEIYESPIQVDFVAQGMVGRLRSLNVPREAVVLRDLARKSSAAGRMNHNLATAWRLGE